MLRAAYFIFYLLSPTATGSGQYPMYSDLQRADSKFNVGLFSFTISLTIKEHPQPPPNPHPSSHARALYAGVFQQNMSCRQDLHLAFAVCDFFEKGVDSVVDLEFPHVSCRLLKTEPPKKSVPTSHIQGRLEKNEAGTASRFDMFPHKKH